MATPLALDNVIATLLVFGPLVGSVLLEHRRFRGDTRQRVGDWTYLRLQAWQIAGLIVGVLCAKEVLGTALPGNQWLWPVCGCAVELGGITLRWWAIKTLGAHFTRNLQVAGDQELVTAGPYRSLRHPAYTGSIIVFAGFGIGLGNALSLAACILLPAIGYVQRIASEEKLLRRTLGEPYVEYARQTHRLLPGIW